MVVLVDEYDKPILDALDEPERAKANRDDLRGLCGTLKDCDAHVELSFITGVSRFNKVSLFSGLNNLVDLTLDPDYSAICGYTDADLDRVFAPELPGLDRDEIRAWYDGYGWLGEEKVYNPFGLLKLFRSRRFEAHWFETGTPRFLVDTLIRRGVAFGPRRRPRQRGPAVGIRRGRRRARGVAVPDRLPHHPRRGSPGSLEDPRGSECPPQSLPAESG